MLRFITSSTSAFSTRLRVQLVANANSVVSPNPSSTNDRMMRLRRRRRYRHLRASSRSGVRIRQGDAGSYAGAGRQKNAREWIFDHREQERGRSAIGLGVRKQLATTEADKNR